MSSTKSSSAQLLNAENFTSSPLSLSHLIIQLILDCTDQELIHNVGFISSLITQSAAFDGNKHVKDESIKQIVQQCLGQEQTSAQISTLVTNVLNFNNIQLSKLFQRFALLLSTPLTTPNKIKNFNSGLLLIELFISQSDYQLLQSVSLYIHQTLSAFIKAQNITIANLPTSQYLRAMRTLLSLYFRCSTPGWTNLLSTLPSLRSILDSLFITAFTALQLPRDVLDELNDDEYPEIIQLYSIPISTLTSGSYAVIEYILQLLYSLLSNNATLPLCKTHIPHIHALIMLLIDLDIHTLTIHDNNNINKPTPISNNRLLPLMGQIFALSCYAGKFNDIKQSLTFKTTKNKSNSSLLLPFPAQIFLHGLAPQNIHNLKSKSDANPTGEAKKAKNTFNLDEYLETAKTDDDGNGILVDTTKTAEKAITGGKGDLKLTGGTITKDIHQRQFQGSQHLLALKVAADDKIAENFLTDEFQSTQQIVYNKQQQIVHLDLKRCICTMLITTIINHLLQSIPQISTSYQTLLHLQQSLAHSQANAGFDLNHSLSFELIPIKTIHQENFQYQQLITSRTISLLTLLQSLLSISPTSLQQSGQNSTGLNSIAWLGFGGPGALFMQNQFRELSTHKQQSHNLKITSALTGGSIMSTMVDSGGNNHNNHNNNNNKNNDHDNDTILITSPTTLPTSLKLTFGTQNEQIQRQQINQQHYQFECPLFRIIQLLFTIFEFELNSISMTKEIALFQQFLPQTQTMALNVLQTLISTAGKQLSPYIATFIPQLYALYQVNSRGNRNVYLLNNINLITLQQSLLTTFCTLLQTFSITIFPSNILSQFLPLILFDLSSYIHDLIAVQHQFRLIGATQKENKEARVAAKDAAVGANIGKENNEQHERQQQQQQQQQYSNKNGIIPLNHITTLISTTKTFTFTTSLGVQNRQQQTTVVTNSNNTNTISHNIIPHSLDFPTPQQQTQREAFIISILNFLSSMFSTSTSSLILTNDIIASVSRVLITLLTTVLTPYGTLLLPLPTQIFLSLLSLLHNIAQFRPSIGSFSPILGQALNIFTWVLHCPDNHISQFSRQCLKYYSNMLSPAMTVPSLPMETILALNSLRDKAIVSLAGGTEFVIDQNKSKTIGADSAFTFGGNNTNNTNNNNNHNNTSNNNNNNNNNNHNNSNSSSTQSSFGLPDPMDGFPLLLYTYQQSNSPHCIGKKSQKTSQYIDDEVLAIDANKNDQYLDNVQSSLDNIMLSMYHYRVRTLNFFMNTNTNNNNNNNQIGNTNKTTPLFTKKLQNQTMVDSETDNDDIDVETNHIIQQFQMTAAIVPQNDSDQDDGENSDNTEDESPIQITQQPFKSGNNTNVTPTPTPKTTHTFNILDSDDNDDDGDDDDLDIDFVG